MVDDWKNTRSSRYNSTAKHKSKQRLWQHTEHLRMFKINGVPALRKKNYHCVSPFTYTFLAIDTWWERENQFLQMSPTGMSNTFLGSLPYPKVYDQSKQNPVIYYEIWFILLCFLIFYVLLIFYFFIFVFFSVFLLLFVCIFVFLFAFVVCFLYFSLCVLFCFAYWFICFFISEKERKTTHKFGLV